MAVLKGHEVLSPLDWGDGLAPPGSFVEAGVLSDDDVAALIAARAIGPEEMREVPDDALEAGAVEVFRALDLSERPAGDAVKAATAASGTAPGAASATISAGFRRAPSGKPAAKSTTKKAR